MIKIEKLKLRKLLRISYYEGVFFGIALGYALLAWRISLPFSSEIMFPVFMFVCAGILLELLYRRVLRQ